MNISKSISLENRSHYSPARIGLRGKRLLMTLWSLVQIGVVISSPAALANPAALSLTNLHTFLIGDGANPRAGLVQAADGNFYGTTVAGTAGPSRHGIGSGTVFQMTPAGAITVLHSFVGTDGEEPYANLVEVAMAIFTARPTLVAYSVTARYSRSTLSAISSFSTRLPTRTAHIRWRA